MPWLEHAAHVAWHWGRWPLGAAGVVLVLLVALTVAGFALDKEPPT